MNCKRCGAALAPGALGCPVCGEPADGGGAGGAFSEGVVATGMNPLSADDLPQISAGFPESVDATVDAGGLAAADEASDEGKGEDAGFDETGEADACGDPFAPQPAPAFAASAGFSAQEQQDFEPLAYMDPAQLAYAGPGPDEPRARMRTSSKVLIALVVVLLVAALAGIAAVWAHNTRLVAESNVRYTVTYETNGGSRVESQEVKTGTLITAPREPTISGRYFAGWYTDTTYQTQVTFPLEVDCDMTLYARWLRDKDKADKAKAAQDTTQDTTTQGAAQGASQNASSQGTSQDAGTNAASSTETSGS